MGKILVFGGSGQVGSTLAHVLGSQAIVLDHPDADFANPDSLNPILNKVGASNISAVINAAAYTQVDKAESEEALASKVNGDAPGVLARWCAEHGLPFVHYSTDYVFSGEGTRPWTETDTISPLNAYARTKVLGEQQVAKAGGKWLLFRTSWAYDAYGKNFVRTMLRLGQERESIRVVNDQHGAPTYVPHLVQATLRALENSKKLPNFPSGIYHLCNAGETTWHGFANQIFEQARTRGIPLKIKTVEGIPTEAYPTPAKRPHNSRMSTEKAKKVLDVALPDWSVGLRECMGLISAESLR